MIFKIIYYVIEVLWYILMGTIILGFYKKNEILMLVGFIGIIIIGIYYFVYIMIKTSKKRWDKDNRIENNGTKLSSKCNFTKLKSTKEKNNVY